MRIALRNGLAAVLLSLAVLPAVAQEDDGDTNALDDQPHITIIGTASTEVVPDLAEISLGVHIEKPTAGDASAATAKAAHDIVEAAKAQGVDARDIRTQSITLTQTFDDVTDTNGHVSDRKPRGFLAGNEIVIRTRMLDKVGALAQSLIGKGATELDGLNFSVEHPERVMEGLLASAVRDARRQAEIAANAAGIKLGRVMLIERPEEKSGTPMMRAMPMGAARAAAAIPVEAGTQTLHKEIEVTWAIEP